MLLIRNTDLFFDQVQQQIQRALVEIGFDAVLTGMEENRLDCHELIINENSGNPSPNCRKKGGA